MESQNKPKETLCRLPRSSPWVSSSVQNLPYRAVVGQQVAMCKYLGEPPARSKSSSPLRGAVSLPLTLGRPLSPVLEGVWQTKQSPCSPETGPLAQQVRQRSKQICKMSRGDKGWKVAGQKVQRGQGQDSQQTTSRREEASHVDSWRCVRQACVNTGKSKGKSLRQEPACVVRRWEGAYGLWKSAGTGGDKAESGARWGGQVTDPGEDFGYHSARDGEYDHHRFCPYFHHSALLPPSLLPLVLLPSLSPSTSAALSVLL